MSTVSNQAVGLLEFFTAQGEGFGMFEKAPCMGGTRQIITGVPTPFTAGVKFWAFNKVDNYVFGLRGIFALT